MEKANENVSLRFDARASNLELVSFSITMTYDKPAPGPLLTGRPTGISTESIFVVFSGLLHDLGKPLALKPWA